jgi:hypothetical protein
VSAALLGGAEMTDEKVVAGIKDSGERREFDTGAVRDMAEKKGKMSLMPFVALFLISCIYEDGALKYAARNWEKGIPISVYVDSAMRHLSKYMDGLRDEPHLSMAGWNICCALWTAVKIYIGFLPKELNDLPHGYKELSPYEEDRLNRWYGKKDGK